MITFRKYPVWPSGIKYGYKSRQMDQDGSPLYEYIYLGLEINMFDIYYKGNVIARMRGEENVVDFIQGHYVGHQFLAEGLAL